MSKPCRQLRRRSLPFFTAAIPAFPPQLVQHANTLLIDRILFGSDFPLITPDRWMKDFEEAGFKDSVKPLILKANAVRLLGLKSSVPAAPVAIAGRVQGPNTSRLLRPFVFTPPCLQEGQRCPPRVGRVQYAQVRGRQDGVVNALSGEVQLARAAQACAAVEERMVWSACKSHWSPW